MTRDSGWPSKRSTDETTRPVLQVISTMGSVQKPKLDPWDRPGKALEWHRVKLTWVLSLSLVTLSFRGPQRLPVKGQEPPPRPQPINSMSPLLSLSTADSLSRHRNCNWSGAHHSD